MINVYYVSGTGSKTVRLDRKPYWLQTGSFLDHKWEYTTRNKKIRSFSKSPAEKDATLTVFGGSSFADNWDSLHEIFDADVRNMTPGKLYFGSMYLECYIIGEENADWEYDNGQADITITVLTDRPNWIQEKTHVFQRQDFGQTDIGFEYEFEYPFEYTHEVTGSESWDNEHYAESDFEMLISGPCVSPAITVNGHLIKVVEEVATGEYMVISSLDNSVLLHKANGTVQDCYDSRSKEESIFDKLPAGCLKCEWTGGFTFRLTLFCERSKPKWK